MIAIVTATTELTQSQALASAQFVKRLTCQKFKLVLSMKTRHMR
nr:hypothetical protein [Serratia ureilytica]